MELTTLSEVQGLSACQKLIGKLILLATNI